MNAAMAAATGSKKRKRPDVSKEAYHFRVYQNALDLSLEKDFGVEECLALAHFLSDKQLQDSRSEQSVTKVSLGCLGIGPAGGQVLAESLKDQTTVKELDLERNGLGSPGACAIFEALNANRCLTKLNMSLNDIKAATTAGNDSATKAIGEALANNTSLRELRLVRSGLGPKGGKHLANGLTKNSSLVLLDLEGNDVMADGGQAIGEALKTNQVLLDLNLRWNRIGCGGDRGIKSLAEALTSNQTLQKLDMSVNELYSEGALVFGMALSKNHSLLELSFERNEIGASGAAGIGQALGCNESLERLVLSGNPMMGDFGAAAIGVHLSQNKRSALTTLELVGCGIGVDGAHAIGRALESDSSSLRTLRLEKNQIGSVGCIAIAAALGQSTSLQHLNLSCNRLQADGGYALAKALETNRGLLSLDLSNNDIEISSDVDDTSCPHLVESIVAHPSLESVNLSDNALEIIPIECQIKLSKIYEEQERNIDIDLSDNPLSSPPLGRKANVEGLKAYLMMLLSESAAVTRLRLMVLGFGGVGKSTFCDAIMQPKNNLGHFHSSLIPLKEWDIAMIASWARRLGTHWAPFIASVLETNRISGYDLPKLIVHNETKECSPSCLLKNLVEKSTNKGLGMYDSELKSFARAIESLMRKGYFSTVGAVKLDGLLELDTMRSEDGKMKSAISGRKCTLVDFAGQMEYLVSHQLLLSSLHTLCIVLQPAPSFPDPRSRHNGSWMYWSKFLRALGDRRKGSLLLAISQLDKVGSTCSTDTENSSEICESIDRELATIRSKISNISDSPPLRLEYRPEMIDNTIQNVREALSEAANIVARDWWVPASYEKLAELVRKLEAERKANRELPIISRMELHNKLCSVSLDNMYRDPQLFQRGIDYLEAVGDVMADHRLDCLLLDPISWFASFLAHFIRDDDIVTSVQLDAQFVNRGVVTLEDVIKALQHDYAKPREQVTQVMSLVCGLELCILCNNRNESPKDRGNGIIHHGLSETSLIIERNRHDDSVSQYYLFPCLLPHATEKEMAEHWPIPKTDPLSLIYRGYRLRSSSGFFPPGLFPGLLARCRLLRSGIVVSERMWKNCTVLVFTERMRVLLRIEDDTLDIVASGITAEDLFVGGAKGQASAVIWMTHVVKMFLRKSYPQLTINESFLCPSAECHMIRKAIVSTTASTNHRFIQNEPDNSNHKEESYLPFRSKYYGSEFPAVPKSGKLFRGTHSCEADGCWNQLGTGHKIESMILETTDEEPRCKKCHREPRFGLRN